MSINIQEYENTLNNYSQVINAKKNEIANAEKELLVAQTHLTSFKEEENRLEEECLRLTGKSISELDKVIGNNMKQLERIMNKVNSVPDAANMTEEQLQDTMQFTAEELA